MIFVVFILQHKRFAHSNVVNPSTKCIAHYPLDESEKSNIKKVDKSGKSDNKKGDRIFYKRSKKTKIKLSSVRRSSDITQSATSIQNPNSENPAKIPLICIDSLPDSASSVPMSSSEIDGEERNKVEVLRPDEMNTPTMSSSEMAGEEQTKVTLTGPGATSGATSSGGMDGEEQTKVKLIRPSATSVATSYGGMDGEERTRMTLLRPGNIYTPSIILSSSELDVIPSSPQHSSSYHSSYHSGLHSRSNSSHFSGHYSI